jgi:mandelate racemase
MEDSAKVALLASCIGLAAERPPGPSGAASRPSSRSLCRRDVECLPNIDAEEHPGAPVVLKLKRPVVARIATLTDWPLILIDLYTEEGVIGRAYLEPYIPKSMRYLIPALHDLGEMLKGRRLAPIEIFEAARKLLHFVGYEGMSMIAVAGIDMAAWDALARAAGVPLCVLLGGSIGAVPAYNSNGLWLRSPAEVAREAVELREEGGFEGLKLRLGRERLSDDLATIEAIREAVGTGMSLMVDFNQGLHLGEALERCHAIDDLGLA